MEPKYFIGEFDFVSITPFPPIAQQRMSVQTRVGTDGVTLWRNGKRGELFTVSSVRDTVGLQAARSLLRQYQDAVGQAALEVTFDGEVVTGYQYMPWRIGVQRMRRGALGVGGLANGDTILQVQWTLFPLEVG